MKLKTFATYLPIFTGFYNTIFDESDSFVEYETDNESEFRERYPEVPEEIPWDFIQRNFWECIDCHGGNLAVAKACANTLPGLLPDYVKSVEFEELRSPREYNFDTDAVNLKITVDVSAIRKFLKENRDAFAAWLKRRYTSRGGFMSSYPNDLKSWCDDTKNFSDMDGHYCGAVLAFIASEEMEDPVLDMYYAANGSEAFCNGVTIDLSRLTTAWEIEKSKEPATV